MFFYSIGQYVLACNKRAKVTEQTPDGQIVYVETPKDATVSVIAEGDVYVPDEYEIPGHI